MISSGLYWSSFIERYTKMLSMNTAGHFQWLICQNMEVKSCLGDVGGVSSHLLALPYLLSRGSSKTSTSGLSAAACIRTYQIPAKLCQMELPHVKKCPVPEIFLICLSSWHRQIYPSSQSSTEPAFISLAAFVVKFAYLALLLIPPLVCIASHAHQLRNK